MRSTDVQEHGGKADGGEALVGERGKSKTSSLCRISFAASRQQWISCSVKEQEQTAFSDLSDPIQVHVRVSHLFIFVNYVK